ncbi:MAG TPA: DUF2950 domain-containing protein [Vicinamibacterales bacterium]
MSAATKTCLAVVLAALLSVVMAAQSPTAAQPAFATPEEAVEALGAAAKASDLTALVALLGKGSDDLATSSDAATARRNRDVFVAAMAQHWKLEDRDATHKELVIGHEAWPFPVPLVKGARGWTFDAAAGREEVLARRIGRNELAAIRVANTFVKAQKLYASRGHDGKPAGIYARRVASEPGTENGLYWPADPGKPRSPLGDLVAEAAVEGRAAANAKGRSPFHGYYFRILEAQGPAAAGGAKNYIVKGELSGGFAMIAWPAQPGLSGVMTFMVNQDGVVYEKSLGKDTASAVAAITRFNPDKSWTRVTP